MVDNRDHSAERRNRMTCDYETAAAMEAADDRDPYGRAQEELDRLDKADFDWKLEAEDKILRRLKND